MPLISDSPFRRHGHLRCLVLIGVTVLLNAIVSILLAARYLPVPSKISNTGDRIRGGEGFSFDPSNRDKRSSSSTISSNTKDFSACLLVMDDAHYLQEFLAYHYHALNLRRVIVAMDPNSQTSPEQVLDRWKDIINVTFWWNERNYSTVNEFQSTLKEVQRYFGPSVSSSPNLADHKARQRVFYQQCLRRLKAEGMGWTLLMDTDEYLTIHYDLTNQYNITTLKPDQPGAVAQLIQTYSIKASTTTTQTDNAWNNLQSSPCLQIPRIRYGAKESSLPADSLHNHVPDGWNATDFLTLRWRYHARPKNHPVNKITKAVLDLSRVSLEALQKEPLTSIHLPVRSLCSQTRLHTSKNDSFLVIHHYLGSLEQYQYRENDARLVSSSTRSLAQFEKLSKAASIEADDDEIRPWLDGFVQHHTRLNHNNSPDNKEKNDHATKDRILVDPQQLLHDVGKLQPKSWTTYMGDSNTERCALCFFGLPRAFGSLVLPSIIQNILIPNARHNCDVFVHFYQQESEPEGRKNRGGIVDPTQVYQLQQAVTDVQEQYGPVSKVARTVRKPLVVFTYDTNATFWESKGALIETYQTLKDSKGRPVYFPYNAKTYQQSNLDNIVKQWHSIENAFKLMVYTESHSGLQNGGRLEYTRVGMFRSDAFFAMPLDIALWQGPGLSSSSSMTAMTDSHNQYAVQAGFAQMPVNDRLFYGPRRAVEIWATQRFDALEGRARLQPEPGYTMHSERFLNYTIFPLIEREGYTIVSNPDLCCLRVRADDSVMLNDCSMGKVQTRGWDRVNKQAVIQDIVGRNCTRFKLGSNARWVFLGCGGPTVKYATSR